MKAIKVLINGGFGNEEEAKAVQDILFGMGYYWRDGKVFNYINAGYYVGDINGKLTYGGSGPKAEVNFILACGQELVLKKKVVYTLEENRETIKIGEHTYYKDEFEKAIANLQTV
jgi:hypothetical protein